MFEIFSGSLEPNPKPFITINNSLLNRKRLFSSQDWIHPEKIKRAILGCPETEELPISVYQFRGNCYLVVDGHHRVAKALVNYECIDGQIIGVLNDTAGYKIYGFNKIVQQFKLATKSFC